MDVFKNFWSFLDNKRKFFFFIIVFFSMNALDKENEKYIFENLKNLKAKKTIIIISHDQDNLKICDYILRVENKKLVRD